jgi:nitroimidazol reductase NimA-like FMN-containing flavoprotein (pyridoxamine 5'-phosphate oxidase superfamily)
MAERAHDPGVAKRIVDENRYLTIATADGSGLPWVSPVWYAPDGYSTFYWVSRAEARHSRNIEVRPEVAIVIFDSRVPVGEGQALYASATAHLVEDEGELGHGIEVFSRRSLEQGAAAWTTADVLPPAEIRLYRATATEHFLLGERDERVRVDLD